jgi:hypothetical protein
MGKAIWKNERRGLKLLPRTCFSTTFAADHQQAADHPAAHPRPHGRPQETAMSPLSLPPVPNASHAPSLSGAAALSMRLRAASAAVLIGGLLAGCANIAKTPPGTSLSRLESEYGKPTYTCTKPDGTRRVIWSQQPSGSYAWGTDLDAQGRAVRMENLMSPEAFSVLKTGDWTPAAVTCEFGPPARKGAVGLGDKYEQVWTYHYVLDGRWHSNMYVYLGRNGDQVTHYHSGPDGRYHRSE